MQLEKRLNQPTNISDTERHVSSKKKVTSSR